MAGTGEPTSETDRKPQRLRPIGFWSYSRQDDELSGGMLSRLRALLMSEIQQQYGRERIQLFQDVSAIPHGAQWEHEIRAALGKSSFFIPIVTPNFIQSEWCTAEVRVFLERERELLEACPALPRRSLIFPLQLIDIEGAEPQDSAILAALQERQWFDFRSFRHRRHDDPASRQALAEFASSIRTVLQTRLDDYRETAAPPPPPPDPLRPAVAPPPPDHPIPPASVAPAIESRPGRTSGSKAVLWGAIGGVVLVAAIVAVVLFAMRSRMASRVKERRAAAEAVQQNQAAPADNPQLATAAGPGATVDPRAYAWLLGDWGYANCSLIVHIAPAPAGVSITMGSGQPETVRVSFADQQNVETAPYHFQRDADGVAWYSGTQQLTRLVPCPHDTQGL